ncbi:MAG: hypothetical protein E7022_03960 [Desulfovibrio desulfuricans]|nr:hypothetical protein [Desulfovibrio desulfuricans]
MSQTQGQGIFFFFVRPDAEQEESDFKAALGNENARRIFRLILSVSRAMGPSYARGGRSTEYNEGLRAVGLWLAAKIEKAAPGQVAALLRESGEDFAAYMAARKEKQQ